MTRQHPPKERGKYGAMSGPAAAPSQPAFQSRQFGDRPKGIEKKHVSGRDVLQAPLCRLAGAMAPAVMQKVPGRIGRTKYI